MLPNQSAIKWPNVPDVYNWLMLDERGDWRIKEEKISHKGLIDFINAHYQADDKGRWFFQNGPQRVFVTLAYTPYVLSVASHDSITYFKTHNNVIIKSVDRLWIDNKDRLLVSWKNGIGLVSDRDLPLLADKLTHETEPFDRIDSAELDLIKQRTPSRSKTSLKLTMNQKTYDILFINTIEVSQLFGFNSNPSPPLGVPDC
jgi:hypothetical protein